ncbi:class I SAM-dependent methyltransferase [Leptobacterium flavescens]|uniref:Class I SAM-dependent methyltransferase n=1 Tax=Leptobacterium flavescens TaxID=472055 RepID=A0A6P0UM82_9FLAO|nr:class I SAM-dependent methyltransferase [Leptobacterium flavescens]NER13682.1 class I SAM-dependent methyltransferase [Leptobacterium flavescens]
MKRVRRSEDFEVNITINRDTFINPPRQMQRGAVVNRALKEFTADLFAIHEQAKHFVAGSTSHSMDDRSQGELSEQEIMEDWQIPVMQTMADVVCDRSGDILEIGFGRGISSDMIQEHQVDSHTIMECNDSVIDAYHQWKQKYEGKDIRMVRGLWQDTIDDLGLFDGIFFHTYPLNEEEYMKYVNESITFAEHFFPHASAHLKPGGSFTYFSNEIDSLSREHQRLLLKHFSSFQIQVVSLQMPEDVKDTWWANSIVVVKAIK